jgi:hypothetical protein
VEERGEFLGAARPLSDRLEQPEPGIVRVGADTVRDGAADGRTAGCSVLEAGSLDAAVDLVRDHPFIGRGGSLQVTQAIAP